MLAYLFFFWDGFGGAAVQSPSRIEYTMPLSVPDYTLPNSRPEFTVTR